MMKAVFTFLLLLLIFGCVNHSDSTIDTSIDQLYQEAKNNAKTLNEKQDHYCKLVEAYLERTDKPESIAKLEHIKALNYHKKRELDSALVCFDRALSVLNSDSELKYDLLINAARDAADLTLHERFEIYLSKAEMLVKKIPNPQYQADCIGARGIYHMNDQKYSQAIPFLEKADSILAANSITNNRDYYHYLMATSYRYQKSYAQAFEHLLKSKEICLQNRNTFQLLRVYKSLAVLYRKQKRYDEAIKWHEKELNLARLSEAPSEIRAAYEGLAIAYTEMNDWTSAEYFFNLSLEEAIKTDNAEAIGVALTNMANFSSRRGDDQTAIRYFKEALEHKQKAHVSGFSLMRSYLFLGKAYANSGQRSLARETFEQARPLADSMESAHWKSLLYKEIYELYKVEENYPLAIQYITEYLNLRNEADNQESEKIQNELMVKYETREKDQQIAFEQQEVKTAQRISIGVTLLLVLIVAVGVLLVLNKRIRDSAVQIIYRQHLQSQQKQEFINQLIKEKTITPQNNNRDNHLLNSLIQLLEQEKIYRQQDLSLEILASKLGTNNTYVSQLINKEFGCNFNCLINRYRIEYCKRMIKEKSSESLLMKEIGFEAGFASQSTFYKAFKDEVGITPLQFQRTMLVRGAESSLDCDLLPKTI